MSTRPITLTVQEAAALLRQIRGAQPVTFTALTKPEQKINTAFGGTPIRKLVRVNAMTGCYYDRALKKATGEEARPERAWGEHSQSAIVEKPAKDGRVSYYLPVQLNHVSRPLFLVPGPTGKLTAVAPAMVLPYLRQRPEQAVKYKDYALASLLGFSLKGRRYRIRQEA